MGTDVRGWKTRSPKQIGLIDFKKSQTTAETRSLWRTVKHWVVNIFKHKLTNGETAVLAKGLNFTVCLDKIPHEDIITATELAAIRLVKLYTHGGHAKAESVRSDVMSVLSKQTPKTKTSPKMRCGPSRKLLKEKMC